MLTEHTYDSAVFEIFLNIITIYLLLNNNQLKFYMKYCSQ